MVLGRAHTSARWNSSRFVSHLWAGSEPKSNPLVFITYPTHMSGVGLMVRVVGLGSEDLEFKSHSVVELIPGGVDSARNPFDVGKMSARLLVSCVGVVTRPGL